MNRKIYKKLNEIIKDSPHVLLNKNAMREVINCTFHSDIEDMPDSLVDIAHVINEEVLSNYFAKVWQPETKKYKYSGLAIIDQVNALNPKAVLDVGCGYNEFKGKIQNLTGIDPFNTRADIMLHTLEYETDIEYDVTICLGSINFGSADKIVNEIKKVVGLTKKGGLIIFRANPGIQHQDKHAEWIDFFEWDQAFIMNVAHTFNCEVLQLRIDEPADKNQTFKNGERFYFVFEKQ